MLRLHCPRCQLSIPVESGRATARTCPSCLEEGRGPVALYATSITPGPLPARLGKPPGPPASPS